MYCSTALLPDDGLTTFWFVYAGFSTHRRCMCKSGRANPHVGCVYHRLFDAALTRGLRTREVFWDFHPTCDA